MKKIPILVILLCILSSFPAFAQEKTAENPGITMGITGIFGTSTIDTNGNELDQEPGYLAGGGFIFQKSLNGFFSIGSGLEYRYFNFKFTAVDDTSSTKFDAKWTFQSIAVPFHLITTIKGPSSSLDIHAGATCSYIFSSKMTTNDTLPSGMKSDDIMRFTNAGQIAASGGLIFRFKVTEFTDFFMGVMGEYYFTDLLTNPKDGESFHLLNYTFNTGYLFRTDIF